MAESLTPEQRYEIITRDLQEVIGGEDLLAMLKEGKNPKIYWGTATTGRIHLGSSLAGKTNEKNNDLRGFFLFPI